MDSLSLLIDWATTSPAVPGLVFLTLSAATDTVLLQSILLSAHLPTNISEFPTAR